MYDPMQDPRYLPPEVDLPAEERERLEVGLAEYERDIQRIDQMLLMFARPCWEMLMEGLGRVADELDMNLQKEKDPSTWKFYRGQLAQVEWFQSFAASVANEQRKLRRDHAQLMQALGKE